MSPPFKIIGHRGAAGYEQENTLASFRRAIDMGLEWVEFDVRLSVDGEPVVVHDANLSRVFGRRGTVSRLSANALAEWGVPTLDEVLALLEKHQVGAYVEIKACSPDGLDRVLSRVKQDTTPRIVSSFDHDFLRYLRSRDEQVHLQPLFSSVPFRKPAYLDKIKPSELGVSVEKLRSVGPRRILGWGYPVVAYTVNEVDLAHKTQQWGLVGVFSDYPDLLETQG
jgi:glycerophosphoryl diester phosphodiesterase